MASILEAAPRRVTPTGVLIMTAAAAGDRPRWLAVRREGVGSSDLAAILGVSAFQTARQCYYTKTGDLPEDDDISEPALWGNLNENTVAREWARRNKAVIRRIGVVAHEEHRWARCTLDRLVVECPLDRASREVCSLEVKTRSAWVAGNWRAGIPDDVHAQVAWQMFVAGFDHVHVACLLGGNDYRQYVVRRDPELEQTIHLRAAEFWFDRVLSRVPPPESELQVDRELDLEDRLHPNRVGTLRMGDREAMQAVEAIYSWVELGKEFSRVRRDRDVARLTLLRLLGDNDTAVADNELLYTYGTVNAARQVDLEKLMEQFPDAYTACVEERQGRKLNIAKRFREGRDTAK